MLKHYVEFFMCLTLALMPGVGCCASNGCDNEKNEYINPALALCSTHVYNIGHVKNPTDESERGYMRDMVALKTTIMTQQLNKQYEYLESMIGRFKTQLEKAVLKTKLQTSGAAGSTNTSGDASSSNRGDRNVFLSGVKNCNNELSPANVVTCLNNNLNTISNATDYGNKPTSEAKKQLINDFKLLNGTSVGCQKEKDDSCFVQNMNAAMFRSCMDEMRACLRTVSYKLEQDAKQVNMWPVSGQ